MDGIQGGKPLMKRRFHESFPSGVAVAGVTALSAIFVAGTAQAWEPTKTVEFIVPAGEGGGADQMARMIQGIVQKHGLMGQSMVVINKSAGAGAEGFMEVVQDKGNEHKVIITLSNRSEEHTSELQSLAYLVCRLLLEKKKSNLLRNVVLSYNVNVQ